MTETYTIGVDYGTLSGRAVVVRTSDGAEVGAAVHDYGHGVLSASLPDGTPLASEWALQHPTDYVDVLRHAVPAAVRAAGVDPADIVGIATDFTACTILPTTDDGTPLCTMSEWASEPHAYVKLWKHHAAQPEADLVNAVASRTGQSWLTRYGSKISSEWFVPKVLEVLHDAPHVYRSADRFIEAADWIVWQLTGLETRNACTAGYKAMFQDGDYPGADYFSALHADLVDVVDRKMSRTLSPLGGRAGDLTERAAAWTGLRPGIAVAVGNVDAHVTAPAAGVVDAGTMVAIMGTSTCHVLNGSRLVDVPGMCGVVDGGIVPGLFGYEAGQSGVGDIFGWFVEHAVAPEYHHRAHDDGIDIHQLLERDAALLRPGQHGLVALDWWNGNRSVLVDAGLSGMIVGVTLQTRSPDIYRALIEATAFGTRTIVENFESHGVPVNEMVIAGGLVKNQLLLQIYADVLGRPLDTVTSASAPALGSAMHAAVAAGVYPDIAAAAARMSRRNRHVVTPNRDAVAVYDRLHAEYTTLHDYFGRGANDVMKRLKSLAEEVRS